MAGMAYGYWPSTSGVANQTQVGRAYAHNVRGVRVDLATHPHDTFNVITTTWVAKGAQRT